MSISEAFKNFTDSIESEMDKLGFRCYGIGFNAALELLDDLSDQKHNDGDTVAAEVLRWAAKEIRGDNES